MIDDNDWREEMLYRSMDNLIETQTGGGDILNANNSSVSAAAINNNQNSSGGISQQVMRRNSELNSYAEIAISDQNDAYGSRRSGRVTNMEIQAIRNGNK